MRALTGWALTPPTPRQLAIGTRLGVHSVQCPDCRAHRPCDIAGEWARPLLDAHHRR
ncbi:hypothetical protein [Streptomyces sp. NPDC002640]